MIYHLLEYLSSHYDFAGDGLIQYITVRSIAAVVISLLVSMFFGWKIIRKLRSHQIGEEIRSLGLEGEDTKKGTPTMGGIIIILSILVPTLLLADLTNIYIQLLILSTVWLGGVGFIDDYIKVVKKDKKGLNGKYKIIGQVVLGAIVGTTLWVNDDVVIRVPQDETDAIQKEAVHSDIKETVKQQLDENEKTITYSDYKSTKTTIPFVKENEFDYKWLAPFDGPLGEWASCIIYILVIIFVITAVSNGTNLTDGIDGLATGTSAIVGATIGILAYVSGNIIYADYLNIMYIPYTGEVVVFMAAFTGALIGFLWYNSHPAQVFMGDTGSLTIGGIIAVAAIIIRKELLIPLLCGIFLVESLSVILQRYYFKYTKKKYGEGRRIFKMTPLHHHFQKEGIDSIIKHPLKKIPEQKLVTRFWIVGILLAVLTIITLKIR